MSKTVLITGASSGIGKATALCFAARGWNVIAAMRTPDASGWNGEENIWITRMDVQEADSIAQAVSGGIAQFGRIDVLVNNAGYGLSGIFEALSPEKIREQFEVNVFGVMDVTQAILPHFRTNGGGGLINVSSRAGLLGLPLNTLYCASKYALEGFSEALYYELASQNIAVKLVEPSGGVTDTRFPERMMREREGNEPPSDYHHFLKRVGAVYTGMQASRITSAEEVARVIYGAATDGTDRLRYFTGEDVGGLAQAKRELPEDEFIALMRARFSAC